MLQGTLNRTSSPVLDTPELQRSSVQQASPSVESRLPFGLDARTIFQAVAVTSGSMLTGYVLFSYRARWLKWATGDMSAWLWQILPTA